LTLEVLEGRDLPSFTAGSGLLGSVSAVAVGDFNNDKNLDLASISIGDLGGSTLTVQLGNKAGIFHGGHSTSVGVNATALAVGNFNKDNRLDVIVVTQYDVRVLLGNGDGTFSQGSETGSGAGTPATVEGDQTVAVGDFNGDGKLDAVVVGSANTVVLLGNGNGGFTSVRNVGPAAASVAVADVNGDGKLDIVSGGAGLMQVQLGNGDGTFRAPQNFAVPPDYYGIPNTAISIALADVNGDGKLDIVTGTLDPTGGNPYETDVLLGNGDGTFGAARTVGPGALTVAVADFNHDGKLDIVSVGEGSTNVELGNGDGTFQSPLNVGIGGGYVAVADFNHDGYPDLAVGAEVFLNDKKW
jgi:hypothetical protein